MIRIVLIGSGNVASHLISAFAQQNLAKIIQVYTRNKEMSIDTIETVHDFSELKEADVYLIAVTDQAISDISNQIPFHGKLVVHTSGSVPLKALSTHNRRGVFYPLQTFSKNKSVTFKEIPICIEAENATDLDVLKTIAESISDHPYEISSEQRKALHVAAVFVCNFVNHLYRIGSDICNENNIPFKILEPLILETASKIATLSPEKAQTGPAKRKDTQTINAHLAFLTDKEQQDIYKLLTKSIIDHDQKL